MYPQAAGLFLSLPFLQIASTTAQTGEGGYNLFVFPLNFPFFLHRIYLPFAILSKFISTPFSNFSLPNFHALILPKIALTFFHATNSSSLLFFILHAAATFVWDLKTDGQTVVSLSSGKDLGLFFFCFYFCVST